MYVHAQIAVAGLRDVGLSAAPGKVVVGDPSVALGLRVGLGTWLIDCPPLKRASMLAALRGHIGDAVVNRAIDRSAAETLVGRLCNLSQIYPELKSVLHGGYAVVESTWVTGGRRRRPPKVQLGKGGEAQRAWLEMLVMAEQLLEANAGVPLAPERTFPARTEPGVLTVTSDASGIDGVGGYAFDAAEPNTVWLVAATWPPDVLAALQESAAIGKAGGDTAALSMPAAELFGTLAVTEAVAEARGQRPSAVVAVGDCDPAMHALNAASSGNPQMRALLAGMHGVSPLWLGVSVPREANGDADRLSHPHLLDAVRAEAEEAGLHVEVAAVTDRSWAAVRRAMSIGAIKRRRP